MQVTAERPKADQSTVIRRSEAGALRGRCDDGICRFLGVPYAAPLVGPNRFKEPQPAIVWPGERDARDPGPCAPHRLKDFPAMDIVSLVGTGGEGGEDAAWRSISMRRSARYFAEDMNAKPTASLGLDLSLFGSES